MGYGRLPIDKERKLDYTKNGTNVLDIIEKIKCKEKELYPLRIDANTVILVPKEKCTESYKIEFLKRTGRLRKE